MLAEGKVDVLDPFTILLLNTLSKIKFQTFHRLPESVCIGNKYTVVTDRMKRLPILALASKLP